MTEPAEVLSHDPWTGAVVHRGPASTAQEIDATIERACDGAERWAATAVEERARALRDFAQRLRTDASALASLIVSEVGKLRSDAEGEVEWTARSAEYYAAHPPRAERAGSARVVLVPLGVVAVITPWNVPLVTPAWKWLPALMAGDAVVWKPSELASGVARAAHDHLLASGIPPDVVALVPGGPSAGRALCADERVAAVHFTGSEAAGRRIAEVVAARMGRCALELSGLNPAIVFEDADLDHAADCIAACATALAGQKCTATRRVITEEAVREPLTRRLAERLAALRPGDPRDAGTTLGPLITPEVAVRVEEEIASAVARGARVVGRSPGGVVGPGGAPAARAALLADLAPDDPLRARELFAPVLSVEAFSGEDDAYKRANASSYGLSAAVYTSDTRRLTEAPRRLRAGVVALNRRGDDVELEAPFGGHKRSGNGWAEGGEWVYAGLTDVQAVYGEAV